MKEIKQERFEIVYERVEKKIISNHNQQDQRQKASKIVCKKSAGKAETQ